MSLKKMATLQEFINTLDTIYLGKDPDTETVFDTLICTSADCICYDREVSGILKIYHEDVVSFSDNRVLINGERIDTCIPVYIPMIPGEYTTIESDEKVKYRCYILQRNIRQKS
jgi:hypothetical protein